MKRKVVTFLLIIACFLIQSTVWPLLPFGTVTPNFLMVLTVSFALMHGSRSGVLTGFVSGLLVDIMYGSLIGMNALLFMLAGYLTGKVYQVFFDDDIKAPLLLVGISQFCYGIIYYIIQFIFGTRHEFGAYMLKAFLPELIYTLIITVLIYWIFYKINKKLQEDETEDDESQWLIR